MKIDKPTLVLMFAVFLIGMAVGGEIQKLIGN
jgi:hypothetical protein